MASHAGLIYVLKTNNGYIDEKGGLVSDINKALRIDFMRFGFGISAKRVYERLGFNSIGEEELSFKTVVPSYDTREGVIADLYREMGFDYYSSESRATFDFRRLNLYDYDNYLSHIEFLKNELKESLQKRKADELLEIHSNRIKLYSRPTHSYNESEALIQGLMGENLEEVVEYSLVLNNPNIKKYFDVSDDEEKQINEYQTIGLVQYLKDFLKDYVVDGNHVTFYDIKIENGVLKIFSDYMTRNLAEEINEVIRKYLSEHAMHITRMFGSYILLVTENGTLKAVRATPVPIKYCPLMIKLLKEVGGDSANTLIDALEQEDTQVQTEMMCNLINEIVIGTGYFDTNRPLNSCEANVTFGASETMSSAFKTGLIDAAVIVSNNLGTIITTNDLNTQGAVKRMTGLFYTTPDSNIVETAISEGIIPVYPITGKIDQLEGVKLAIKKGFKRIAVSVAASDNHLHEELSKLEKDRVIIYKFGLCSTGISKETAEIMKDNADVIWSCSSKYVKELIEPNAIAQVGVKIPVHIMTKRGYEIVRNHLKLIDQSLEDENVELTSGENATVYLNSESGILKLKKKDLRKCNDCPHPCI